MIKLSFCLSIVLLSGCATSHSFDRNDPIDNALKACGLGYTSEASGVFRAAYNYADKEGSADFSAKMAEGIETQVGALTKNETFSNSVSSKDKIDLIKSTQNCVVKFTDVYRPRNQNDLVKECMMDLQQRSEGMGSTKRGISVRNWIVNKKSPEYSEESPVVNAQLVSYPSTYDVIVKCHSKNYVYTGLAPIESE
ncbi:MAG: hypothetical protein ACRC2U_04405 [Aeromonas sp.]